MTRSTAWLSCWTFTLLSSYKISVNGFSHSSLEKRCCNTRRTTPCNNLLALYSNKNNDDEKKDEAWDANVDYEKEWPKDQAPPDPSTAWDALPNMPEAPKLGIDISLEPLSEEEAKEIKEEAKEIINSKIDAGVEEIEKMRAKMTRELEKSRKVMQVASELEAQKKSGELMDKIGSKIDTFLESTRDSRTSTKTAAAASRAMEGRNEGIEMGTWGTLGGRTVLASDSLLGSVENAKKQQDSSENKENSNNATDDAQVAVSDENRIIVIADTKQVCAVDSRADDDFFFFVIVSSSFSAFVFSL